MSDASPALDWPALRARLARSPFRSRFQLSEDDRATLARTGWPTMRLQALAILRERLAPAVPPRDGKQTPMRGHPVFKAQHATACCCRDCLYKWHRIPKGRPLSEAELAYMADVLLAWMHDHAGDLSKFPEQKTLF